MMFSIIIPVYNGEEHIKRCIDSLLSWPTSSTEIIVVDDCSTDGTLTLLTNEYAIHDNIEVVHNKTNMGVSYSRNKGLDIAIGKYILFLDADDYLVNESYVILSKSLEYKKSLPMIVRFNYAKDHSNSVETFSKMQFISALSKIDVFNSSCTQVFSRELVDKIRFHSDIAFAEDLLFNFEIANKLIDSDFVLSLGNGIYSYEHNRNSATQNRTLESGLKRLKDTNTVYELILSKIDDEQSFNNFLNKRDYELVRQLLTLYPHNIKVTYSTIKDVKSKLKAENKDKLMTGSSYYVIGLQALRISPILFSIYMKGIYGPLVIIRNYVRKFL